MKSVAERAAPVTPPPMALAACSRRRGDRPTVSPISCIVREVQAVTCSPAGSDCSSVGTTGLDR